MANLPEFNLNPQQIQPKLTALLQDNLAQINQLLDNISEVSWDNLVPALEELEDRLQKFWSPIAHLHAVQSTPELRAAYQACLPLLTEYQTNLAHHIKLYRAYRELKDSASFSQLDTAQKRAINLTLRDFRLAGIDLSETAKKRYAEIENRLAELSTLYGEHVLDATQAWRYVITDPTELAGLPQHVIDSAVQDNNWVLTLDYPCYSAVQKYAKNRTLRQTLYQAYVTRASDVGTTQWDNTPIMQEILFLRYELAKLLGFENFPELVLATHMAKNPGEVLHFLEDLVHRAQPLARQEFAELEQFAGMSLEPWDIAFYSEQMSQARYHITQESLRVYFPLEKVLDGLFKLINIIYGMEVSELQNIPRWQSEVRIFSITDKDKQLRGYFYLDLYVRENKREGAWMDDYCSRRLCSDNSIQVPVAFLTCNFTRPQASKPALLTHDEVITLFHEFGHGLHHLLTKINYLDVSGMHGVPWDAVEFPSQFMENWCWQPMVLKFLTSHYETGKPIPEDILQRLLATRHFHAGLYLMRQLEFALFDYRLHLNYHPEQSNTANYVKNTQVEIQREISVVPMKDYQRFAHTFSHIFDGGYAAGYYSYLWAEVLASDAFSLFEELGILNQEVGQRFLENILEQGGAQPPLDLFIAFRGRKPDSQALFKQLGLIR